MQAKAASTNGADLPSLLLYHLSQLHLQLNLGVLQAFARDSVASPRIANEGKAWESRHHSTPITSINAAVWHAKTMLRAIRESLAVPGRHHPDPSEKRHVLEPPHLPYSIYFSTLVTWYGEYTPTGSRSLASNACIQGGIQLLGMLKVRVAKVLAGALRELLPDEDPLET